MGKALCKPESTPPAAVSGSRDRRAGRLCRDVHRAEHQGRKVKKQTVPVPKRTIRYNSVASTMGKLRVTREHRRGPSLGSWKR